MTRDPNAEAYKVLRGFWTRFRRFVKDQLVAHYGPAWEEEGLPESIRKSCTKHRGDRDSSRRGGWVPVEAESLLDFAFDEHLREIIIEETNWNGIFKHFFGADTNLIGGDLRRICWVRDEVAHWRPVTWKQVRGLRAWCEGITGCVARAATMQADSKSPVGFVSPDELLAGKESAELLAWVEERAASAEGRGLPGFKGALEPDTVVRAVRQFLLENQFELGASPDESDVQPTKVHQYYDEWVGAPKSEVLMWQSYAPREPVSRGSEVQLSIRYNPVAVKLPGAKAKHGVGWWRRRTKCAVRDPDKEQWEILGDVKLEPEGWTSVEYVPRSKGRHDVTWGARPSRRAWVRDEFDVR